MKSSILEGSTSFVFRIDFPGFEKCFLSLSILSLFLSPIRCRSFDWLFVYLWIDYVLNRPFTAIKHGSELTITISFFFEKFDCFDLIGTEFTTPIVFCSGDIDFLALIGHLISDFDL